MSELTTGYYGTARYGETAYGSAISLPSKSPSFVPDPAPPRSTTSVADRLYERLLPLAYADKENGYALLKWCRAAGAMIQEIEDLARSYDGRPGWADVVDADRVPEKFIPWLAQFVGVRITPGMTFGQKRAALRDTTGWRRGSRQAIIDAVQPYLEGNRTVLVIERDGNPYKVTVATFTYETPNPALAETAARSQKPAGIKMTYLLTTGLDYFTLRTYNDDYAMVDSNFTDYEDVRRNPAGFGIGSPSGSMGFGLMGTGTMGGRGT